MGVAALFIYDFMFPGLTGRVGVGGRWGHVARHIKRKMEKRVGEKEKKKEKLTPEQKTI